MSENNVNLLKIGERISLLIKKNKITQKELAEKAGVTEAAVSHYIKGDRVPRAAVVARLAETLGTSVDYLMCGVDNEKTNELEYARAILARNASRMTGEEKREFLSILIGDD